MPARRLRRLLYRVETGVSLAAGLASAVRASAFLPPNAPPGTPPTLSAFTAVLPLWVYGALWLAVVPLSVAAVWVRRLWVPTVASLAGLCVLTGVIAVLSTLILGAERGWSSAAAFGLLAVFIGSIVLLASIAEQQQALLVDPTQRGR